MRAHGYLSLIDTIIVMDATPMSETGIAKLFKHGRSQAVRLPLAFRMPGDRVRVRRVASGILLEPIISDPDTWFAALDRFADKSASDGSRAITARGISCRIDRDIIHCFVRAVVRRGAQSTPSAERRA